MNWLEHIKKGDIVIYQHSALWWSKELVQNTWRKTHIIVDGKKFRRSDGRQVGVREGTQTWYYVHLREWDEAFFNKHQQDQQVKEFVEKHHFSIDNTGE